MVGGEDAEEQLARCYLGDCLEDRVTYKTHTARSVSTS